MKQQAYKTMCMLGVLLVLVVASVHAPRVQAKDGATTDSQIVGTWLFTITPPAAAGFAPFTALASFARGGVFLGSTQNDQQPPLTGAQQGTWKRTGDHEFSSTQISFAQGAQTFTFKVNAVYHLEDGKPNQLEGVGQLSICDASVNNCHPLPGCATIQGKRLEVEPPSCSE
jgi:hypothetical protein